MPKPCGVRSATNYRRGASVAITLAAMIVLTPNLAFPCNVTDIQSAPSPTKAAKDNFDSLVACVNDLQARLIADESRLARIEGQIGTLQTLEAKSRHNSGCKYSSRY